MSCSIDSITQLVNDNASRFHPVFCVYILVETEAYNERLDTFIRSSHWSDLISKTKGSIVKLNTTAFFPVHCLIYI